eukprot:c20578_g1_i2.p1 GENE.c20578_g1_i2~~c20578_g1_i2.p1  ORF type:complete len:986 (+),score=111.83 c20578_g1_i2:1476-4433(+)
MCANGFVSSPIGCRVCFPGDSFSNVVGGTSCTRCSPSSCRSIGQFNLGTLRSTCTIASDRQCVCDPGDASCPSVELFGTTFSASEISIKRVGQVIDAQPIPPHIRFLTDLKALILHNNMLSGTLVSELGVLSKLTILDLHDNNLVGEIGTSVGRLVRLQTLRLSSHRFSAQLPSEIGLLTELTDLNLASNILTGLIPTTLGLLTRLTSLDLSNNFLLGTFPSELGNLVNLRVVNAFNNALDGFIPTRLFQDQIRLIRAYNNRLDGTIPSQIGKAINLILFDVYGNRISGTVPSQLGRLKAVQLISLGQNSLGGRLPIELGALANVTSFNVDETNVEVPSAVCAVLTSCSNIARTDTNCFCTVRRSVSTTTTSSPTVTASRTRTATKTRSSSPLGPSLSLLVVPSNVVASPSPGISSGKSQNSTIGVGILAAVVTLAVVVIIGTLVLICRRKPRPPIEVTEAAPMDRKASVQSMVRRLSSPKFPRRPTQPGQSGQPPQPVQGSTLNRLTKMRQLLAMSPDGSSPPPNFPVRIKSQNGAQNSDSAQTRPDVRSLFSPKPNIAESARSTSSVQVHNPTARPQSLRIDEPIPLNGIAAHMRTVSTPNIPVPVTSSTGTAHQTYATSELSRQPTMPDSDWKPNPRLQNVPQQPSPPPVQTQLQSFPQSQGISHRAQNFSRPQFPPQSQEPFVPSMTPARSHVQSQPQVQFQPSQAIPSHPQSLHSTLTATLNQPLSGVGQASLAGGLAAWNQDFSDQISMSSDGGTFVEQAQPSVRFEQSVKTVTAPTPQQFPGSAEYQHQTESLTSLHGFRRWSSPEQQDSTPDSSRPNSGVLSPLDLNPHTHTGSIPAPAEHITQPGTSSWPTINVQNSSPFNVQSASPFNPQVGTVVQSNMQPPVVGFSVSPPSPVLPGASSFSSAHLHAHYQFSSNDSRFSAPDSVSSISQYSREPSVHSEHSQASSSHEQGTSSLAPVPMRRIRSGKTSRPLQPE